MDKHVVDNTNKLTTIPLSINEEFLGKQLSVNSINGIISNIKIYINKSFSYASSIKTIELGNDEVHNFL